MSITKYNCALELEEAKTLQDKVIAAQNNMKVRVMVKPYSETDFNPDLIENFNLEKIYFGGGKVYLPMVDYTELVKGNQPLPDGYGYPNKELSSGIYDGLPEYYRLLKTGDWDRVNGICINSAMINDYDWHCFAFPLTDLARVEAEPENGYTTLDELASVANENSVVSEMKNAETDKDLKLKREQVYYAIRGLMPLSNERKREQLEALIKEADRDVLDQLIEDYSLVLEPTQNTTEYFETLETLPEGYTEVNLGLIKLGLEFGIKISGEVYEIDGKFQYSINEGQSEINPDKIDAGTRVYIPKETVIQIIAECFTKSNLSVSAMHLAGIVTQEELKERVKHLESELVKPVTDWEAKYRELELLNKNVAEQLQEAIAKAEAKEKRIKELEHYKSISDSYVKALEKNLNAIHTLEEAKKELVKAHGEYYPY